MLRTMVYTFGSIPLPALEPSVSVAKCDSVSFYGFDFRLSITDQRQTVFVKHLNLDLSSIIGICESQRAKIVVFLALVISLWI